MYSSNVPNTVGTENEKERQESTSVMPPLSSYLLVAHGGAHWFGRDSVSGIVVFGDSYSASLEGESKTWVDYLPNQLGIATASIHKFAFPGASVEDDMEDLLSSYFQQFPPKSKDLSATLIDHDKTLFVFYLGINDCGGTTADELEPIVETVLDAVHNLYTKSHARNFLFIDVPPTGRSPGALEIEATDTMKERVDTWNDLLRAQVEEFAASASQATVFIFSSHAVLTDILDDPEEYDFTEDDTTEVGAIWQDGLHLTSAVHEVLAEKFVAALGVK
ncbi:hypothetical protein AX16_004291 [Volvariella volvacea WC 439]|nr:hypothetical protein AX16_004291 [Volvariella volvacea WC 439]